MTQRKFYKTRIEIEVLSEEPIPATMELDDIVRECREGAWSMCPIKYKATEINGRQAASALLRHGSDTEFFQLTPLGEDSD